MIGGLRLELPFVKMHGCGNDYIFFDMRSGGQIPDPSKCCEKLCDRHFGIGGDGIVLILPSDKADAKMRMFNSDGSEGKMCGNAIRCVGKYLYDVGATDRTVLLIETESGLRTLDLLFRDHSAVGAVVDMGIASAAPELICEKYRKDVSGRVTSLSGKYRINAVSVGNPHCVVFTDDIDTPKLDKLGRGLEFSSLFTERVNVELALFRPDGRLNVRVWERGSGETLACGTGACAAAFAACSNGYCDWGEKLCVQMRGGELEVVCRPDGETKLAGDAVRVFSGVTEV